MLDHKLAPHVWCIFHRTQVVAMDDVSSLCCATIAVAIGDVAIATIDDGIDDVDSRPSCCY